MTHTDGTPPPAGPIHAAHALGAWDACDHCQAPLDERQRYCVVCGARRPQSDDPVAGWFVANARRLRAVEAAPPGAASPPPWRSSSLVLAVALALLPVAAAVGVSVGRGETGDATQLVKALEAQKAPVVNVIGGGGDAGGGAVAADDAGEGEASAATRERAAASARGDDPDDADGRVIARTRYGTARELTDSRVTPEQLDASRRALRHIVESQGRDYVDQQRNLPDQIVIP
jgi:hypothetical protein